MFDLFICVGGSLASLAFSMVTGLFISVKLGGMNSNHIKNILVASGVCAIIAAGCFFGAHYTAPYCPNCGKLTISSYCEQCGEAVNVTISSMCPDCGVESNGDFCGSCGTRINQED